MAAREQGLTNTVKITRTFIVTSKGGLSTSPSFFIVICDIVQPTRPLPLYFDHENLSGNLDRNRAPRRDVAPVATAEDGKSWLKPAPKGMPRKRPEMLILDMAATYLRFGQVPDTVRAAVTDAFSRRIGAQAFSELRFVKRIAFRTAGQGDGYSFFNHPKPENMVS